MTEVVYRVPEMHCGACEQAVRKALLGVEGIREVRVELAPRIVCVRYEAERVVAASIRDRIEAAGFDVEPAAVGAEGRL